MQSWKDSPGSVSSGKDMPERVRSGISPHFSSSSRALAAVPAFIIAVSKSKDGLKRGVPTGPRSQLIGNIARLCQLAETGRYLTGMICPAPYGAGQEKSLSSHAIFPLLAAGSRPCGKVMLYLQNM